MLQQHVGTLFSGGRYYLLALADGCDARPQYDGVVGGGRSFVPADGEEHEYGGATLQIQSSRAAGEGKVGVRGSTGALQHWAGGGQIDTSAGGAVLACQRSVSMGCGTGAEGEGGEEGEAGAEEGHGATSGGAGLAEGKASEEAGCAVVTKEVGAQRARTREALPPPPTHTQPTHYHMRRTVS